MYNDAEEDFEDKLRLENDLNGVVIGHWKSHDGVEEYYSKVGHCLIFPVNNSFFSIGLI